MEKQPLISVVIPAYNCEKYIAEALDSVINQTYENLEIIVVNDCSPDDCELEILEYLEKDKRIKYFRNEVNQGVAYSRNFGVSVSSGEFIAFLDSDDAWSLNKLEKQIKHLQENNGYLCYASYKLVNESGQDLSRLFIVPDSVNYKKLLYRNVINCSTVLIKRNIIIKNPMTSDDIHEDYIAWLSILKKHGIAFGIRDCMAIYRQVDKSKSNNKLKSFIMTNRVYKKENINFFFRIYYLFHYSINGIKKYWI